MRKAKLALLRFGFALVAISRIYSLWSKVHRVLFDGAAKLVTLPTFSNFDDLLPVIRGFVWRPDSWQDLGDAVCTPEMVWYRHIKEIDAKVGDCDEYAVFEACCIQKSIEAGTWNSAVEDPDMMSVSWFSPEGKMGGHNVCLFRLGPCYGYMDYDKPRWCGGKAQVAAAVVKAYSPGADMIGWAVHSTKLKLREWHIR